MYKSFTPYIFLLPYLLSMYNIFIFTRIFFYGLGIKLEATFLYRYILVYSLQIFLQKSLCLLLTYNLSVNFNYIFLSNYNNFANTFIYVKFNEFFMYTIYIICIIFLDYLIYHRWIMY